MKQKRPYWHQADLIMRSSFGQTALQEGWGRELYCQTLEHGWPTVETFKEDDVEQLSFRCGIREQMFADIENQTHPLCDALVAMGRAELALEAALRERYLQMPHKRERGENKR